MKPSSLTLGIAIGIAAICFVATTAIVAYTILTYPTTETTTQEATAAPVWLIKIENGNVVKSDKTGNTTILVDKEDYDDIERFSDVATSPDYSHICFLAHKLIPVWMYHAKVDGSDVTETAVAENCVWSHDSEKLAYTNHTTDVSPHNVHVYSLLTEKSTNLTGDLSTDTITRIYEEPVWSADDTTITSIFESYDSDNNSEVTTGTSVILVSTGVVTDTLDESEE